MDGVLVVRKILGQLFAIALTGVCKQEGVLRGI